MKLDKSIEAILGTSYTYSVTEALLNFFGVYVKDVYEYNELPDELKEVMPEYVFEYLTRQETTREKIETLFRVYEPTKFGFVTNTEEAQIKSVLGLSNENTVEELVNVRNEIVDYTHKLVTSGTLLESEQLKVMDKMSAFVCIIDRLKVLKGAEA